MDETEATQEQAISCMKIKKQKRDIRSCRGELNIHRSYEWEAIHVPVIRQDGKTVYK